ncbi:hypothetical protein PR001_g11515 [Phytophthora rubi]|uniref:Uncharacterized protein n=1 Tax=Phytophthora rubi TaxID=129364 RepID=A0A6A3MAV2_9STRA|nr:hypothetical protein PR001_g11515 [Phytophthora rubi]
MDRKIARALVAVQCCGRSGGRHVVASDSRQVTGSFRPAKQTVHRGRDRHSSDFFFCGRSLCVHSDMAAAKLFASVEVGEGLLQHAVPPSTSPRRVTCRS